MQKNNDTTNQLLEDYQRHIQEKQARDWQQQEIQRQQEEDYRRAVKKEHQDNFLKILIIVALLILIAVYLLKKPNIRKAQAEQTLKSVINPKAIQNDNLQDEALRAYTSPLEATLSPEVDLNYEKQEVQIEEEGQARNVEDQIRLDNNELEWQFQDTTEKNEYIKNE